MYATVCMDKMTITGLTSLLCLLAYLPILRGQICPALALAPRPYPSFRHTGARCSPQKVVSVCVFLSTCLRHAMLGCGGFCSGLCERLTSGKWTCKASKCVRLSRISLDDTAVRRTLSGTIRTCPQCPLVYLRVLPARQSASSEQPRWPCARFVRLRSF